MTCIWQCGLASGLIFASLYISYSSYVNLLKDNLVSTLDDKQRIIYYKIVRERFGLYMFGLLAGLVVAALYLASGWGNSKAEQVCSVIAIITIVQVGVYKLFPKSDWLLTNFDKKEQVDAWLEMYKFMSYRYHMGFIIGLVGYGLLCLSLKL